jgi:DNA-binding response OmpR family regulator
MNLSHGEVCKVKSGKKRVLIADDSKAVRQRLKIVLDRHVSCELVEAEDGQEAFEKLQSDRFDILITDLNMPRMNGLSLIGRVRKELNLRIPIVIVTTMGHEEDRDAGMRLGADTYITKPINGSQLISTVSGLIN